jgi:hypothetical protein
MKTLVQHPVCGMDVSEASVASSCLQFVGDEVMRRCEEVCRQCAEACNKVAGHLPL